MGYHQVLQHIAVPICTDHGFIWAKQVEFFSFKLLTTTPTTLKI